MIKIANQQIKTTETSFALSKAGRQPAPYLFVHGGFVAMNHEVDFANSLSYRLAPVNSSIKLQNKGGEP